MSRALIPMNKIVNNVMGVSQEGSTGPKLDIIERPLRYLHCILMLRFREF